MREGSRGPCRRRELRILTLRELEQRCTMRRKIEFAPDLKLSPDELKSRFGGRDSGGIQRAGGSPLPDELVLDAELQKALMGAIRELPQVDRCVVWLRDVEELTTEETAEALEISAETVKTRLHLGRLALRRQIDQCLRNRAREAIRHER